MVNFDINKIHEAAAKCTGYTGDLCEFISDPSHSKTVLRKMNYTRNLERLHIKLLAFVKNSDGSVAVSNLKQLILDSVREVLCVCYDNQRTTESFTYSEVEKVVRSNLPAVQE